MDPSYNLRLLGLGEPLAPPWAGATPGAALAQRAGAGAGLL